MSGWHAKTGLRGFEDAVSSCAVICMGAAKDQWAAPPHGTRQPVGLVLPWASHLMHPTDGAPGDLRQEQVAGLKTALLLDRVRLTRLSSPPLCRANWSRQSASHDRGLPGKTVVDATWREDGAMLVSVRDESGQPGPVLYKRTTPDAQWTPFDTGYGPDDHRHVRALASIPGSRPPYWPEERLTWRAPPMVAGSGRACGANGARSTS